MDDAAIKRLSLEQAAALMEKLKAHAKGLLEHEAAALKAKADTLGLEMPGSPKKRGRKPGSGKKAAAKPGQESSQPGS